MEQRSRKVKNIALMGILLAMVMVFSAIEQMIPPLPFLPPNVKLGLSNVIVMYTIFFLGTKYAYTMAVLKSLFVFLMRGATAAVMSLTGGLLSLTLMVVLLLIFRSKVSYLVLSVFGALGHNIGQMVMASFLLGVDMVQFYWPFLLIAGVLLGSVTGVLLGIVMPIFNRINGRTEEEEDDG